MDDTKKIDIQGQTNRYAVKKLINNHKEEKTIKKRVISEKWTFEKECYEYSYQLEMLKTIFENKNENINVDAYKTIIQEIKKKIQSYKQQDQIKKHYEQEKFLTFENVIKKLIECELKCRYCDCEMFVLYDISREMKQWSVDRVDNNIGHNDDNFHLACLDCNLKRRRRTDEKFLFTKKLNLVKKEN